MKGPLEPLMRILKEHGERAAAHGRMMTLLVLLVLLGIGLAFYRFAVLPVNPVAPPKIVDIPKGAGFFRITEIMNEAGLVANRPFFWLLALGKGATRQIRAGEYEISGNLSPSQIIEKLVRGEIKAYLVTLPEDLSAAEVSRRLAALKLVNEKEFMALAADREFLASLGIEANHIEGYLFPQTYQLDRSMTTREVIRILVKQFWKSVTPQMIKRAKEMGLTLNEWLTLASIIGKESGNREEKPLISAVFHNRLVKGMRLQSDPTAVYYLEQEGKPAKAVLRSHLQKETPHNTYRIYGLPPGPIANPGLDSLKAALYPARTNYLYFVAKNDGFHQFSANLAQHNRAVSKYQSARQKK